MKNSNLKNLIAKSIKNEDVDFMPLNDKLLNSIKGAAKPRDAAAWNIGCANLGCS